jgi:hypothetical protein
MEFIGIACQAGCDVVHSDEDGVCQQHHGRYIEAPDRRVVERALKDLVRVRVREVDGQ